MTPIEREIQRIRFQRYRTLGTVNPFCATCGERRWWARYELHHIAGRKSSDRMIRLCLTCHNGISIMQRLLPPLDSDVDPRHATLIAQLEGSALLHDLAAENARGAAAVLRERRRAVAADLDDGGSK